MMRENPQSNAISQTKLIEEIMKISMKIDNITIDGRNIRKRLDLLKDNSFNLGIQRYHKNNQLSYQFDECKKKIVKYLTFSENSNLFLDFDIEASTLRALKNNSGIRHIHAGQKKNLSESFEHFIIQEKTLGLSDELAERNLENFWKFIREDKIKLNAKVDFENDFFYQYDLFETVLQYRSTLFKIADDEYQADDEFQNFIDRFTELESYLLTFCKEYFIRKIQYDAKKNNYAPYSLDRYFGDIYDEPEYDYECMDSEEILSIITEILTNGR